MDGKDLIRTETENRIAKEFFVDFTNTTTISNKLYPNKKNKNVGIVTGLSANWSRANYIDIENKPKEKTHLKGKNRGKKYLQKIPMYRLNLNFFFDYAESLKINLPKSQKDFINWIFEFKNFREGVYNREDTIIDSIINILNKIFFIENIETRIDNLIGGQRVFIQKPVSFARLMLSLFEPNEENHKLWKFYYSLEKNIKDIINEGKKPKLTIFNKNKKTGMYFEGNVPKEIYEFKINLLGNSEKLKEQITKQII